MFIHLNKYNLSSFVIFFIVLFSPKTPISYLAISLLPLSFVLFSTSKVINDLKSRYVGIRILYYLFYVKFVVSPLFISLSGFTGNIGVEPSDSSIGVAVTFQIVEILTSFIVLLLVGSKILPKTKNTKDILSTVKNKQSVFFLLVIIVTTLLVITTPELLTNYTFVSFSAENTKIISVLRGIDIHLMDITKLLILVLITRFLASDNRRYKRLCYILSLLFMGIFICILRNDNRLQIVISIIISLVLSRLYFPKQFKKTIVYVMVIGVTMLLSLSYYRIFGVTEWRPNGGNAVIDLDFYSGMLQSYFSGVRNTAQGYEAMTIYANELGFDVLFADLFSWSGYLANFIIDKFGEFSSITNDYFNLYLYGPTYTYGDQIIPSITQSYAYFSFIGAFIFPLIFTLGIIFVEKINLNVNTIEEYIVNVHLMSILAMFIGYSISSIGMYIFGTYLIWFILFRINNLISVNINCGCFYIRGRRVTR